MLERVGGSVGDIQVFSLEWSYIDENSYIFSLIPSDFKTVAMLIYSYLCQGYYYMSIAFDLGFDSTMFGGWNSSIQQIYLLFGIDNGQLTYLYKLGFLGIDPRVNWHSAYTWIANDVSFFGVPLIIYIISYVTGASWVQSINVTSFTPKILFIFLSTSSIFTFSNTNFISYNFSSVVAIFLFWSYKMVFRKQVLFNKVDNLPALPG
jgi:hypothetical protein